MDQQSIQNLGPNVQLITLNTEGDFEYWFFQTFNTAVNFINSNAELYFPRIV